MSFDKLDYYYFFDPHPGFGGPIIPLPPNLKKISEFLNQQVLRLSDAIQYVKNSAGSGPQIEHTDSFISAQIKMSDGTIHSWRLISFKPVERDKDENW